MRGRPADEAPTVEPGGLPAAESVVASQVEPDRTARRPKRRRWRWLVAPLLAGALGYGVGIGQPFVVRPPLVVSQDAISDAASRDARVTLEQAGGRALVVRPAQGDGRLLFILYPGGLVRPQAYEWLARALAIRGVMTVIPEFAADLAVTDAGRAGVLIEKYAAGRPVVLGGHSLGGAMAADYAAKHPDAVRGLVLMAAYPASNVTVTAPWPALSVRAELDGVASEADVVDGLHRLPPGSRVVMVDGAVHAFFGRYGPQAGDGIPTASPAQAEAQIVDLVGGYLGGR